MAQIFLCHASENQPATWKNTIGMEFVPIPAGEFFMGSTPAEIDHVVQSYVVQSDGKGLRQYVEDEMPQHQVRITQPFYLGKYEVTQREWQAVMGNNPSGSQGDLNRPVEMVSWNDVQEFIQKLNAKEGGAKYRLPTEAEWEYACRADSTTAYSFGDDPNQLGEYAWYKDNSGRKTHPVGQLKPNAWGLYDMHGNVWEWVADHWYNNYKNAPNDGRAWIDDPRGASRVVRGGSWGDVALDCRAAFRGHDAPDRRDFGLGFRLARSVALGP